MGCGQGEVAAWLSERGYRVLGVDLAPAAVERARRLHGEVPGRLEFRALDVTSRRPGDSCFTVLVDRGCFHRIPRAQRRGYARNLAGASTPDARLLLFVQAYRRDVPFGDPGERRRVLAGVEGAFAGEFRVERMADTHLDGCEGRRTDRALPGIVLRLVRDPGASRD